MNLTLGQLVALAQNHGFPDPQLAAAVAMAESGGNPNALNDTTAPGHVFAPGTGPERSIGLWQINVGPNANPWAASLNLTNPDVNAQVAYQVSSKGTNWTPWSTYNQGLYKPYYYPSQPATPLRPPNIVPPRRLANRAPIMLTLLGGAALAAAAGYGTHYGRQRMRRA